MLAVAGDAGGARALLPVIRLLAEQGCQVECRAYAAAMQIWRSAGLKPLPPDPSGEERFDRLLVGTSVQPEAWELVWIELARALRAPSLAVLDFWSSYAERFRSAAGQVVLPDCIAVMDERARQGCIASGIPPAHLVVTGQPAFDELTAYFPEATRQAICARVRHQLGCCEADVLILYVSQPLSQLYTFEQLGFDETAVLSHVVDTLGRVLSDRGRSGVAVVKLHPRELGRPTAIPAAGQERLRVVLAGDDQTHPRELVVAADLVVGMNSMLLLEACLLGARVVSYQPGLRLEDPLPSNRMGWSTAVYARDGLYESLAGGIGGEAYVEPSTLELQREQIGHAATRVAELLWSLG